MARKCAKSVVRNYTEISLETDEIKRRLLAELGCSNNKLAELAIRALEANLCQREQEPAA
jgi:hypothetical protein